MLAPMQYRDFVWPNNPRVFEVEYRRTLHSYKLPFSGYVVQNLGLQNKIIRGEGEFVGPKAYENFRRLAALFEENKGGSCTPCGRRCAHILQSSASSRSRRRTI